MPDARCQMSVRALPPLFYWHLTSGAYSHLSATIGSTLVARRAGIQHASAATNINNSVMTTKVIGSTALTPNSIFDINRVSENEEASPSETPLATRLIQRPTTSLKTAP